MDKIIHLYVAMRKYMHYRSNVSGYLFIFDQMYFNQKIIDKYAVEYLTDNKRIGFGFLIFRSIYFAMCFINSFYLQILQFLN